LSAIEGTDASQNVSINTQNSFITIIQGVDTTQNTRLTVIEGTDTSQNTRMAVIEGTDASQNVSIATQNSFITIIQGVDTTQNTRLTVIENTDASQNVRIDYSNTALTVAQGVNNSQNVRLDFSNTRMTIIEGVDVTQNTNIAATNQYATSAFSTANNAYTKANNALANTSGTTFGGELLIGGGGKLTVLAVGGDEGGEILLGQPTTNSSLSGGVTIDAYQNKIRIFEQGGAARGVYIDLTAATGGVGTNLLNPVSSPDTVARALAQAAYDQANVTIGVDTTQNTRMTVIEGVDVWQNTAITLLQSSLVTINSNSAYSSAIDVAQNNRMTIIEGTNVSQNVRLDYSNTVITIIQGVDNSQNANIVAVQALANTDYTTLTATAGVYGNSTFIPVVTLAANGRITSITNTAITVSGGGGSAASGYLANSVIVANSTGYLSNTSNLLFYSSNNNLVITGNVAANGVTFSESDLKTFFATTAAVTANVIATFDAAQYRTIKLQVQAADSTGLKYHSAEFLAVHNGSSANHTEYASVYLGGLCATYDMDYNTGTIRLLATPTSSNNTTYKIFATQIKV
jgi:hypothetical protein